VSFAAITLCVASQRVFVVVVVVVVYFFIDSIRKLLDIPSYMVDETGQIPPFERSVGRTKTIKTLVMISKDDFTLHTLKAFFAQSA
jgi:hypothetical protein